MRKKKTPSKKKKDSRYEKELKNGEFRVSIFGSARAKPGDKEYKMVHKLAEMLGERGVEIVTGSGPGLMRAANAGHKAGRKSKKVHSIGLAINLPTEQITSGSDIIRKFGNFSSRLDNFMLLSNAVIVTPGGVGTLLELFYTWQLVQVKHICNIPIILLGDMWEGLVSWLDKNPIKRGFIGPEELTLFMAKTPEEAIKMIERAHKEYKKGNKNYCLNYKRYKLY